MINTDNVDKIFIYFEKMEIDPLEQSYEGSFENPSFDWSAENITEGPTLSSGALPETFERNHPPAGQVSIPIPIRGRVVQTNHPFRFPMSENRFNMLTRIPSRRYSFPYTPVQEPLRRTERARDQAISRLIQLQVSINELEHRIHKREKNNTIIVLICVISLYLVIIVWSLTKTN